MRTCKCSTCSVFHCSALDRVFSVLFKLCVNLLIKGLQSCLRQHIISKLCNQVLYLFPQSTTPAHWLHLHVFTCHVPVNERQSVESLELSPPLFQQRHIIQTQSRCSAPHCCCFCCCSGFTVQTQCQRPVNASLVPALLFSWPSRWALSRVPPLTAWMCQHSFKSMRRTLGARALQHGRSAGPILIWPTRGLFSCWLILTHLFDKISQSLQQHYTSDKTHGRTHTHCCAVDSWLSEAVFRSN